MKTLIILPIAAVWMKSALGATVSVAAAADLTFCIEELNQGYRHSHPDTELKVSTGSSGNFYTQIEHGAPYDVFLSADISFPRKLVDEGFADGSTLSVYSLGRLALWTTKPDTVSLGKRIKVLRDTAVKRIAIASQACTPYGRSAKSTWQTTYIWN